MQETYSNDYSLLRPFDLEAAKRGEPLTAPDAHFKGKPVWKYAAGPDSNGTVVVTVIDNGKFAETAFPSYCFAMAPLAWVEGKPVYKGDVLYWNKRTGTSAGAEFTATGPMLSCGVITGVSKLLSGAVYGEDGKSGCCPDDLTWANPKQKVKKQIWINVYPEGGFTSYHSKERADLYADTRTRIACVPVEIEYEV